MSGADLISVKASEENEPFALERGGQEGSVTVLAVFLSCLALAFGLFLLDMAAAFRARGEAQGAADAAAKAAGLELSPLFGVGNDPEGAAAKYAAANGAELLAVMVSGQGGTIAVTVTVRKQTRMFFLPAGMGGFGVTATARCYLEPYGSLRMEGGRR